MKNQEITKTTQTVIVYTYRYFFKQKDGKLCVKFLTEPLAGHEKFMQTLKKDDNIVSAAREYVSEVNFAYLGYSDTFKSEKKEDK